MGNHHISMILGVSEKKGVFPSYGPSNSKHDDLSICHQVLR